MTEEIISGFFKYGDLVLVSWWGSKADCFFRVVCVCVCFHVNVALQKEVSGQPQVLASPLHLV